MKRLISFSSLITPHCHVRETKDNQVVTGIHRFRRQIYSTIRRHTPSVKNIIQQLLSWAQNLVPKKEGLEEESEDESERGYFLAPETLVLLVFPIK